jgi:hypothetical protein
MKPYRWALWLTVVLLYAATWLGGRSSHARDLETAAWAKHRRAQERNAEELAQEPPGSEVPVYLRLREGGPVTSLNWCIPLLPGVLLVDSDEVIGPLYGRGGVKIVLYYGTGSWVVCHLYGWIA